MGDQNKKKLVCRKCTRWHYEWNYNGIRAHLRAVHGIDKLPDNELWVYEAYPGSSEEVIKERQERSNRSRKVNRQLRSSGESSSWFTRDRSHHRNAAPSVSDDSRGGDFDLRSIISHSVKGGVRDGLANAVPLVAQAVVQMLSGQENTQSRAINYRIRVPNKPGATIHEVFDDKGEKGEKEPLVPVRYALQQKTNVSRIVGDTQETISNDDVIKCVGETHKSRVFSDIGIQSTTSDENVETTVASRTNHGDGISTKPGKPVETRIFGGEGSKSVNSDGNTEEVASCSTAHVETTQRMSSSAEEKPASNESVVHAESTKRVPSSVEDEPVSNETTSQFVGKPLETDVPVENAPNPITSESPSLIKNPDDVLSGGVLEKPKKTVSYGPQDTQLTEVKTFTAESQKVIKINQTAEAKNAPSDNECVLVLSSGGASTFTSDPIDEEVASTDEECVVIFPQSDTSEGTDVEKTPVKVSQSKTVGLKYRPRSANKLIKRSGDSDSHDDTIQELPIDMTPKRRRLRPRQ